MGVLETMDGQMGLVRVLVHTNSFCLGYGPSISPINIGHISFIIFFWYDILD